MTKDQQLLEMQRILERVNAHQLRQRPGPCALRGAPEKSNRGRRPKALFHMATGQRPARVADEPRMALAFFLRRMDGMSWNGAVADTADEFGLQVKRQGGVVVSSRAAESRVERAAEAWKMIVLAYLMDAFPDRADRLGELMRERTP